LLLAVSNVFAVGYTSLMPAFAKDVLASPEVGLGLMSTAVGVGALLGALLLAALGNFQHKGLLLTAGNLLFPAFVIAFSYSHTMWISLVLLTGTGFGFMVQNATVNTLIQSRVEDRLRGRVMSVYTIVFQGFFPIGALFAGAVAQRFSIQTGSALGAMIALGFGLMLLWRMPKIRHLT
jgi:MFS family permease